MADPRLIINVREQLRRAEPGIGRAYLEAVRNVKTDVTLRALADLLEAGEVEQAIEELTRRVVDPLAREVNQRYVDAGEATTRGVQAVTGFEVAFNRENVRAVDAMSRNELRLVREFSRSQRDATRAALTEGIRLGENPIQQARRFRDAIGLTERQERAVQNYERMLREGDPQAGTRRLRDRRFDSTLGRATRRTDPVPLSEQQVNRMTERYRERFVRHRSEVIGRTEALRSVHEGHEEALDQAEEEGAVRRDEIEETWDTSVDERVRGSHVVMHGQVRTRRQIQEGERFVSGLGNQLAYPGDSNAPGEDTIQCRCALLTRLRDAE